MATLANLVKNINPPRLMTWATYDALPFLVKNDGTLYYITDRDDAIQTAATTAALDKDGNSSNVQTELDSLNTNVNNLLDGTVQAHTAQYLHAPFVSGIHMNLYGSIVHNNDKNTSNWHIGDNTGDFRALQVYLLTGQLRSGNRIFCSGVGDTFSTVYFVGGFLSNNSKNIAFSIPCHTCAKTAVITKLQVIIRSVEGIYPYMKYGNNASSSIQLGSTWATLWENSAEKYVNSINSITTATRDGYLIINIYFTNSLVTTSGGSTSIKTLTPISIELAPTLEFS